MPPTTHQRSAPDPPSSATWIVQKYGGTSVGKFLPTIANVIAPSYLSGQFRDGNSAALVAAGAVGGAATSAPLDGYGTTTPSPRRLAIVCSARSGQTKALGTTNLLLQAAKEALDPSTGDEEDGAGTPSLSNSVASLNGSGSLSSRAGRSLSRSATATALGSPSPLRQGSTAEPASLERKLTELGLNANGAPEGGATATGYNATVDRILSDHLVAIRNVVTKNHAAREQLEADIVDDCERLRDFLLAAKIIEEISPRSRDIIMSIGERLSCRIVVGALLDAGVEAELVGMENIVDAAFLEELSLRTGSVAESTNDAGLLGQPFYDLLSEKMGDRLRGVKGVPVVTGYFGNVPGSLLSQVGRGYTDLCAALCAVGLGAEELQIWKEVDGVFTADPRKVSTARLIPSITPEEAAELTYYGSEVIHPFTMEQAIKKSVPIRIKNVENPTGGGTVIFPSPPSAAAKDATAATDGARLVQPATPSASGTATPWGSSAAGTGSFDFASTMSQPLAARKLPTAVTIKDDVWVLNVHSNRKTISHGFFARIFGTLDRLGVIVDLISTSEVHVSMALSSTQPGLRRPRALERVRAELGHLGTVSVLRDMSILSLVGTQMRNMVGVAGRMFSTLAEGNINIEMISQGANEINISCVIHRKNALKALNLIHYSVLEVSPKPSNQEAGALGRSFF